jgi:hypothetical protein
MASSPRSWELAACLRQSQTRALRSPPDKSAAWWEQFVLAGKLIPKADATEALQLVLAELRMSVDVRALEFPTDNVQFRYRRSAQILWSKD